MLGSRFCSDIRPIGLAAILLLMVPLAMAQKCDRRLVITSDTDVFESPPRYVAGVGWRGNIQTRLASGTAVYFCRVTNLDFGFSSKEWTQIAYRAGAEWPKYGWVVSDSLHAAIRTNPEQRFALLFFISTASAAAPAETRTADSTDSQLPKVAPDLPPFNPNDSVGAARDQPVVAGDIWANVFLPVIPLFIAMLLGMGAKVFVDMLEAWDLHLLWAHLRNGIVAILVSPIVFLGLLNAGQFAGPKQQFLALTLLAFQNGFFWQTVLKRESDRGTASKSAALGSKRGALATG